MKLKTNTHMELVRDNEGELGECVVTRCEQQDSLLQERGKGICHLEADGDQVSSVAPCELGGGECCERVHVELGGYGDPGSACGSANPRCDCPGVCAYECGEMRVETRA